MVWVRKAPKSAKPLGIPREAAQKATEPGGKEDLVSSRRHNLQRSGEVGDFGRLPNRITNNFFCLLFDRLIDRLIPCCPVLALLVVFRAVDPGSSSCVHTLLSSGLAVGCAVACVPIIARLSLIYASMRSVTCGPPSKSGLFMFKSGMRGYGETRLCCMVPCRQVL